MSAPLSLEAPIVREVRRPARRYLLLGLLADQQALGAVAAVAGPQIKAESIAGDQNLLLDGGLPVLPNAVIPGKGPMPLVDINAGLASSAVTWADLRWIRDLWRGPIAIKGVLTGDDARRAIDEGVAAISGRTMAAGN